MVIGQGLITSLMNPTSPIALPADVLDDSSGFRTRYYWAQLISVLVTVPVSFVVNQLWTLRAVRGVKETFEEAESDARVEPADRREPSRSTEPAVPVDTALRGDGPGRTSGPARTPGPE